MEIFECIFEQNYEELKNQVNRDNVNVVDEYGLSLLHYCAQNFELQMAQLLIQVGADVNRKDNYGNSPLFKAVFNSNGRGEMIKLLIDSGANVEMKNYAGVSPKELAYKIANYDVKKFFE